MSTAPRHSPVPQARQKPGGSWGDPARRRRILFLEPVFTPKGGSNAVVAWMIQALKDDYQLTLLTLEPVNWAAMNSVFGTTIGSEEVSVLRLNAALRALPRLHPNLGMCDAHRRGFLMRTARRMRDRYDLMISTAGEADLGDPGILYVTYPTLGQVWKKYEDCGERPFLSQLAALVRGNVRLFAILSGFSLRRMKQNHVLVVSDWTGEMFREAYGIPTETFYPPVTRPPASLPWDQRENAFVALGRLSSEKRFEWTAEVIARVRRRRGDVKLHIIGTRETHSAGRNYYEKLCRLAQENSGWLALHSDLSRDDLLRLLGRMRYGIHAMVDEHFGIAPAEMLAAGCIPFVHASGGQVEIVGQDPRLCFSTAEDACAKIHRVLADHQLQKSLLEFCAARSPMFSTERFMREFRELVARRIRANAARDVGAHENCSVAVDPRSFSETENSAMPTGIH